MHNSSRPSKDRRYEPLTRSFSKWLYQFIDRVDYGYLHRDGAPRYVTDDCHLNLFMSKSFWPQRLTQTQLQRHLDGQEKLYTTSSRKCGFALLRIDIDAHKGQTDTLDAADWIIGSFFQGAYHEPSRRGHGIYPVVRVGFCRRARFNEMVDRLSHCLSALLNENNFQSTIEIQGTFTIVQQDAEGDRTVESRGKLAAMPLLPNREADLQRLEAAPVYLLESFVRVFEAAELVHDTQASSAIATVGPPSRCAVPPQSADAWKQMKAARFHFTTLYRRDPDQHELLTHYKDIYQTDAGDAKRVRRAQYALRYSTFDITAATQGGYQSNRNRIIETLTSCKIEPRDGAPEILLEDLAIYLFAVENRSFSIADHPRHQWTCNYHFVSKMFSSLKSVTGRGGANRNKLKAIRDMLESVGLIECLDRGYVATGKSGICQKWVVGDQNPRFAEWVRFADELKFEKVNSNTPVPNIPADTGVR